MRAAISRRASSGSASTRRLTKLKRTPRTPAACSRVQLVVGDARARRWRPRAPCRRSAASASTHGAVVGAVAGRLHDHVAREAEKIAQRAQLFLRRVAGRVFALGRVRELRAGPKTWQCASTAPGGARNVGFDGIRMEGRASPCVHRRMPRSALTLSEPRAPSVCGVRGADRRAARSARTACAACRADRSSASI